MKELPNGLRRVSKEEFAEDLIFSMKYRKAKTPDVVKEYVEWSASFQNISNKKTHRKLYRW